MGNPWGRIRPVEQTGVRVSARKTREALASSVIVTQTNEKVLVNFLNMSFWKRWQWLLTGRV